MSPRIHTERYMAWRDDRGRKVLGRLQGGSGGRREEGKEGERV